MDFASGTPHAGGEAATAPRGQSRRGGRSARVRAAVLGATLSLLREEGDAFGIPQIAARAGVHETSIYRRWGTREALIVDAVQAHIGEEIPIPDTGTLRGDLTAFLEQSITFLASPLGAQLVRATAPAPRAAAQDARGMYWSRRLTQIGILFERSAERGEIAATADRALAAELLLAPLYFRLLITQAPLDAALAGRLADLILHGVH
jgi:AcrR family transcriptional regulator